MQWSAERNAGFSDGEPWLPLSADYATRNVATSRGDPHSILTLCHRLIALRREHPSLSIGDYMPGGVQGDVFWFERRHEDTRFIVALNFSHQLGMIRVATDRGRVLVSTFLDRESDGVDPEVALRGDEGLILAI
jgi:alpha-glucosidase